MTVADLIERLQNADPEAKVISECHSHYKTTDMAASGYWNIENEEEFRTDGDFVTEEEIAQHGWTPEELKHNCLLIRDDAWRPAFVIG